MREMPPVRIAADGVPKAIAAARHSVSDDAARRIGVGDATQPRAGVISPRVDHMALSE